MPPVAVVVVDEFGDRGPGLGLGGEVLQLTQLELQGRMPRLDDRIVPCRRLLLIPVVISELSG